MKRIIIALCLASALAGCVSKSECDRRVRMAYLSGQNEALRGNQSGLAGADSIWVMGNVRNAHIQWMEGLTLARALVEADYRGSGDPSQIVINRSGQTPVYVSAKQLLNGYDIPMQAGDRIEIKP